MIEALFMISSVEAYFTLLQKPIKMFFLDAIETSQMTLGLIPEILDVVDVILLVGK
jgi:hypothetical protein